MAYGAVATLLPFQLDEKAIYGCSLKYNLKAVFYDPAFEEKVSFAKNLSISNLISLLMDKKLLLGG